ncbi:MAG TPA: hypothetical protein GXZ69_01475 [Spirochaetales bacterium]|jgi:uncharacterized membrane protein YczE|nr:hypothetical protein [Spirochaetales bacterium]
MNKFVTRFIRLFLGLFLYAVGIVLTMKANIGYASWEVFHAGLSTVFGIQIGTVSILVGLVLCVISLLAGEKLGLGTLCNMVFIGLFMNLLLGLDLFPTLSNFYLGVLQMVVGLFVISVATVYYISSGFGAGPRDSLMVVLTRKTRLSVGTCRSGLEILVVVIGALLGGSFGIGTILAAVLIGFCVQITFKLFRFDPTTVVHENFMDTFRNFSKVKTAKQPPVL